MASTLPLIAWAFALIGSPNQAAQTQLYRHRFISFVPAVIDESTTLGIDDSLLESAASCLDAKALRALGDLRLDEAAKDRLDLLAQRANEGQLSPEEAREYDRFIDLGDIIATLRLKAERQAGR